jgi:hypothetical protein
MDKISIAYFSTIYQKGYKSEQIKSLIEKLELQNIKYNCYALDYSFKSFFRRKINNVYLSYFPLIINFLYSKLKFNFFFPAYYNYLLGEELYSLIFSNTICNDDSSIVILKNRPHSLVKKIKKSTNKFVIIDVDQQHPFFTKKVVEEEQKLYNIKSRNIYTNEFAANCYSESFKFADALIVYSQKQKEILLEYGVSNEILVFELGLEKFNISTSMIDSSNINSKEFRYISFANHTILKGTHRLIDTWIGMPNSFKLIIAGNLDQDFLEFLENTSTLPDNIIFINQFDKYDLANLSYNYNLVGISLSLSEAYPRVISEYFELGIPVIVSEIIDRGVDKYGFGRIVNYSNSDQIKEAIYYLTDCNNYFKCSSNIIKHSFSTYDDFSNNIIEFINNR